MTAFSFVQAVKEGVAINIQVQPKARTTELAGLYGERLKLRVAAPPVDGKANKAVCTFFAKTFGLSKSRVQVVSGQTGRRKRILLQQAVADDVNRKLTSLLETHE